MAGARQTVILNIERRLLRASCLWWPVVGMLMIVVAKVWAQLLEVEPLLASASETVDRTVCWRRELRHGKQRPY